KKYAEVTWPDSSAKERAARADGLATITPTLRSRGPRTAPAVDEGAADRRPRAGPHPGHGKTPAAPANGGGERSGSVC
ncbi:hypothetical protein AB0A71_32420, partial [Kitasatospora aureofaciens]|uniref:hypothetical protein n=1 Tax=Kitasatospora aureofaciens TaxID=1894 RepID=UPI0033C3698C